MRDPVDIKALRANSDYWGWVEHDGYRMFLGGNDCGVAMRLRAGMGYEQESIRLWAEMCKDSDLAIDVGAHTGIYSLVAFKSGAKHVCSVEPYYLNSARLDLNLRANGFKNGGIVMGCAMDCDGYTEISVFSGEGYCSTGVRVGRNENANDIHRVPCFRLDSLIDESFHSQAGPIKIDVEKSAKRVLAGMHKILLHKPPIIIEVTEDGLTEVLKPYGYRFYMIDEDEGLSEVDSLDPVLLESGKPDFGRLNRLCR